MPLHPAVVVPAAGYWHVPDPSHDVAPQTPAVPAHAAVQQSVRHAPLAQSVLFAQPAPAASLQCPLPSQALAPVHPLVWAPSAG